MLLTVQIAQIVLLATLLVTSMLTVGTLLEPAAVVRILRRPVPLATGLVVNLVLVPVAALVVAVVFALPAAVGLAVFLAAVAAGGGSGPLLAHHVRGDLPLAASLQGVLALSSVVVVPVWLWLASSRFPDEVALRAPGVVLAGVALFQLLPLVAGTVMRARRPVVADRVHAVARRSADLLLLVVVAAFVATNAHVLLATGVATFAAMSLVLAVSVVTLAIPALGDGASRRGLAMIGLVRNLSLALAIAGLAVDAAATTIAVLTYGFLMYVGAGALLLVARCQRVAGTWRAGLRCLTSAGTTT